jgi:uroporphyrin-3 C-methyltransferase
VNQAHRIDAISAVVDRMPLVSGSTSRATGTERGTVTEDPARAAPATPAQGGASPADTTGSADSRTERGLVDRVGGWVDTIFSAVGGELSRFIRVQRVDKPEALMLAPDQAFFVRENVKLRLAAARAAALNRQTPLMRSDIDAAIVALERYFDREDRVVSQAIASLRQVAEAADKAEPPSLSETLAAIRQARQ